MCCTALCMLQPAGMIVDGSLKDLQDAKYLLSPQVGEVQGGKRWSRVPWSVFGSDNDMPWVDVCVASQVIVCCCTCMRGLR
jgi:hypothetical protein